MKEFTLFFRGVERWLLEDAPPLYPWPFGEGILFTTYSFQWLSDLICEPNFSLRDLIGSNVSIFIDSGAYSAAAMNITLDVYEINEIHYLLEGDYIVPLDYIIFPSDSKGTIREKVQQTIDNTVSLLEMKSNRSIVIGPLQGNSAETIASMYDRFREIGIDHFAIGGLLFKPLKEAIKVIEIARQITRGQQLHVFGKFLHPQLLKIPIFSGVDSVDGAAYLAKSLQGWYIDPINYKYTPVSSLEEELVCSCQICRDTSVMDLQRGDFESQLFLIEHNIHKLKEIKRLYQKEQNPSD
ncbi:MAG: hypothetical protein ACFFCZ_02310 [Promethearchaeota archaeon]